MGNNKITNAGAVLWKVVNPAGGVSSGYKAAGTINASGADFAEWVDWAGPQPDMGSIVKYRGAYVWADSPCVSTRAGCPCYKFSISPKW